MERPPTTAARRAAFRAILSGPACIHPASVHDPIAGRIAADLGFEAAMFDTDKTAPIASSSRTFRRSGVSTRGCMKMRPTGDPAPIGPSCTTNPSV